MTTNKKIIHLFAETPISVGIGQAVGAIDLPVAREKTTHYPFIPGSGVKGAFRVWAEENAELKGLVNSYFGPKSDDKGDDSQAGHVLFSDAKLLLLPVRSLTGTFKYVTCPYLLKRYQRDCARIGVNSTFQIPVVKLDQYHGTGGINTVLGLEEREFTFEAQVMHDIISYIEKIFIHIKKDNIVILNDDDFAWFAQYALPVMARNNLDENKVSKNLWYEESLAPESCLYLLIAPRSGSDISKLIEKAQKAYIQMGGNETIGHGWFQMSWNEEIDNGKQ